MTLERAWPNQKRVFRLSALGKRRSRKIVITRKTQSFANICNHFGKSRTIVTIGRNFRRKKFAKKKKKIVFQGKTIMKIWITTTVPIINHWLKSFEGILKSNRRIVYCFIRIAKSNHLKIKSILQIKSNIWRSLNTFLKHDYKVFKIRFKWSF